MIWVAVGWSTSLDVVLDEVGVGVVGSTSLDDVVWVTVLCSPSLDAVRDVL